MTQFSANCEIITLVNRKLRLKQNTVKETEVHKVGSRYPENQGHSGICLDIETHDRGLVIRTNSG